MSATEADALLGMADMLPSVPRVFAHVVNRHTLPLPPVMQADAAEKKAQAMPDSIAVAVG